MFCHLEVKRFIYSFNQLKGKDLQKDSVVKDYLTTESGIRPRSI